MKLKYRIENNFNSEVFYTTSTGNDLKAEIRAEARKYNKSTTDYKITKI